jgi:hypothetical protein
MTIDTYMFGGSRTAMKILRLYADASGESHFDIIEMAMTLQDFAPPAAPLYASQARTASRFVVLELPVGWGGDNPHPTPGSYMLFCLSGSLQLTSSDGDTRSVLTGSALLMADTAGKGHSTTVTSDTPVTAVMIRLE